MNIDWLGDKIVDLFIEKWFITDFASIYSLWNFKDEILKLEWFKDKSVANILSAVKSSRTVELANFLVSLWIPQVWKKTAKLVWNLVSQKYFELNNNIDSPNKEILKKILFSLKFEELQDIKDIWPVWAWSIEYYFQENQDLVIRLLDELNIQLKPSQNNQQKTSNITWKSFCVTGSFEKYSRDEIHKIIEDLGGEVRTSVSKNLDYLIVWTDAWSKATKAKDLWVTILSLNELDEMVK
jgi:DNA ligase (NAD+)